ncbi:MAG: S-layer homology domain-containing protein, partial [Lachnospiraceae bacterium]|nr:S-layer homology domain-containing protein [Lachnospiraceae bacterium]
MISLLFAVIMAVGVLTTGGLTAFAEEAPAEEQAAVFEALDDVTPADGTYTTSVTVYTPSGLNMFRVIACVLTVENGQMTARITLSSDGYDKLYMGTAAAAAEDEANWISSDGVYDYTNDSGEEKHGYMFTIPVSALDTGIAVAAHGSKWYDRTLTFNSADLQSTGSESVVVDPANVQVVKYEEATDTVSGFKMFVVTESRLTISGETMTVELTTSSKSYDHLYFGPNTDEDKLSAAQGTAITNDAGEVTGYTFTFELPASARGTYLVVTPGKPDGTWYTNQQLYMAIPDADGNTSGTPWAQPAGEVIDPANITCVKDDASEYGMFKIDSLSSTITIDGETMTLHFTTTGHSNYSAVYIGGNVNGKGESDAIPGVLRTDGTDGRVFDIELPASRLGSYVTIRIWNANRNDWVERTVYLAIPDANGVVNGTPGDDQFPFSDPTDNEEFNTAIMWGVDLGITNGWEEPDGTYTFRPWNKCNRASIVTFLWRMAGEPEPQGEFTFSDPTGNDDFDTAITWAVEQGITTGWTSDNTFRPW